MSKPSLARGMRDFLPEEVRQRSLIFSTISKVYEKYGYVKLETPVIENLSVLTEKYGEEGDKLLFKILNSGPYLEDVSAKALAGKEYKKVTPAITEKGLRYDLTVPLARYVVMNRNELAFPFKRYQIDKVWRADRPQKGRYREFYQCDGDAVGSASMLYDAELVFIMDEVLSALNLPPVTIKINNRKILSGLASANGFADKFTAFTVAIDKLDKIGEDGVIRELAALGFEESQIHIVQQFFRLKGTNKEVLIQAENLMQNDETGKKGIEELRELFSFIDCSPLQKAEIKIDFSLARGLDYYTSTIYEVIIKDYNMGSIAGGGRYDELTASFGVPDMPGVGISFGAERIYDVMKDLNLFPDLSGAGTKVLLVNFGGEDEKASFKLLQTLRANGIASEIYPDGKAKIGKQFSFAEKKGIEFVIKPISEGLYSCKNIVNGEQGNYSNTELVQFFQP